MIKLLRNIIEIIVRKIYPIIEYVGNERKRNNELLLFKNLSSCGESVTLGLDWRIEGCEYINIGDHFSAGAHLRIEAIDCFNGVSYNPQIIIGNGVRLEDYCHIGCVERVQIGDGTLIASKVFISDHSHGYINHDDLCVAPLRRSLSGNPISIGKNVWIGDGVCILPGVSLGDNVIVGANTVVTHSFPSNSVIAGCPARLLRMIEV